MSDSLPADESCELLGPTALVVQGVLGVFVIVSLVYKRHREPRKRPWKIWLFDVSKQVVGQMFVHGANVLASDIISGYTSGNACVFYFLHILLDTTLGVGIIYVILHALTDFITERLKWQGFVSGVYGKPPSIAHWARQAAIYVLALTTMKFIVTTLIVLVPGIFSFGEWLLSWTRIGAGDSVQVIFVMGLFPIIMNVLQFWLIDSIVKASTKPVALLDDSQPPHNHDREPLFNAPSDDEDEDVHGPDDIEQARSRSPTLHNSSNDSGYEHKSGSSSRDEPEDHSYPPSLSSSFTSNNSQSRPAKNLLKNSKRRTAPAPLGVYNDYPPAVNSLSVLSSTTAGMAMPIPPTRKSEVDAEGKGDAWTQSWDDQDDWENRHEEEEWTQQRTNHIAS